MVLTKSDKDSDKPAQVYILNTALMAQVKHHRFYVEWINFVSQLGKKALLYISLQVCKFTQLFNAVVCMAFFKVTTSTVTCKCSILTTRQRMTSDLYI